MKTLTTFIILITICSFRLNGQNTITDFVVTIDEIVMTGHSYYKITSDSIIIQTRYYSPTPKTNEFKKALKKDEGLKLKNKLSKIKTKDLKDSYTGKDVSDDNYEFEFTFDINGTYRKTTIYEYKHKDIFELVRQINLLIPKEFSIRYDDKYCKDL